MGVCLATTVPFFFSPCAYGWSDLLLADTFAAVLWLLGDIFFRALPQNERIKVCADVLIYSNLLMIAITWLLE